MINECTSGISVQAACHTCTLRLTESHLSGRKSYYVRRQLTAIITVTELYPRLRELCRIQRSAPD